MTTNATAEGGDAALNETSTTGYNLYYQPTSPGEAETAAAPTALSPRHQRTVLRLAVPLATLVHEQKAGLVYTAPLDIMIEKSPLRLRRPDLFFVSETRMKPDDEPEGALDVGPDLIIEVLSPHESRRTFAPALADYTTIGVCEVWIVSPQSETVEVLRATEDSWETAALFGRGQTAAGEVLPGYQVSVDDLFD